MFLNDPANPMTDVAHAISPHRPQPLRPVIVLFVIFASVMAVVGLSKWNVPAEKVNWGDQYAPAVERARAENKPLLLYFTAEWCGPCQQMRRNVWTDQAVADAAAAYIPVRIDVDKQPQLAEQFQVPSYPFFFVIDPAGRIVRVFDRGADATEFAGWLGQR